MNKTVSSILILASLLLVIHGAYSLVYVSGAPPSGETPNCFIYQNFEGQDEDIFDNGEEWTGYDYGVWDTRFSYPPAALRGAQSLHMNPAGSYPIVFSPQFDARSEVWIAWKYRQFGTGNPNENCGDCHLCGWYPVVMVTASDHSWLGGAYVYVVPPTSEFGGPCIGDAFILVHGSRTSDHSTDVHPGTTRYFWMYFKLSDGSDNGIARIWASSDRFRPADPKVELTNGTATASIRNIRISNGYFTEDSAGRRGYIIDQVMACDSEITEMPE